MQGILAVRSFSGKNDYFCIKFLNMLQPIYSHLIAGSFSIAERQIERTLALLDEGATIPFISRYRKEATGGLDEIAIGGIKQLYEKLCELAKRKETVIHSIEEQEKMTPELKQRIEDCWDSVELEDIYLPYKPKRQTRAEMARKKGLEPLAKLLMAQNEHNVHRKAEKFINEEVADAEAALQGARDIIAEWVNESESARNAIRNIFLPKPLCRARGISSPSG